MQIFKTLVVGAGWIVGRIQCRFVPFLIFGRLLLWRTILFDRFASLLLDSIRYV